MMGNAADFPPGPHLLLSILGLWLALFVSPGEVDPAVPGGRATLPMAPIPIFLAPPASIEEFWKRLDSPDIVLLNGSHYRDLLKAAGRPSSIAEPVVTRVTIRGKVTGRSADLLIDYAVSNPIGSEGWVRVGLEGMLIGSVREGDVAVPVRARGGGYEVLVSGGGEHTIVVAVDAPVAVDGDDRRLGVPIPLAATTSIDLTMRETPLEVSLGGVEPIVPRERTGGGGVRLLATISPRPRVDLLWRPALERSTDLPPLLTSQGEIAIDVTPDSIRSRARWSVVAVRGTCRALTFTIDADEELTEVELGLSSFQVFSIWLNSSSTGVARPKIVTDTRTLFLS